MLQRAYGIPFMLIGAASIVDGWRIAREAREGANFDAIGPDRYLLALGVVMLAAGLWRLVSRPEVRAEPDDGGGAAQTAGTRWTLVLVVAMLAGFAGAAPAIGFSLACFLFLVAQFWLLGARPWWKLAGGAAAATVTFHAAFVWLADMPLPRGYLWD
jgi:Tripartite tricarboxylate transporter TctB family